MEIRAGRPEKTAGAQAALERRVDAVRRFNRFYTGQIGVLNQGYLDSPFSLAEVRVLYELAHRQQPSASELARDLHLDAGYLSRIVRSFSRRGLVLSAASGGDGRRSLLSLTARGRRVFAPLDARARDQIRAVLSRLPAAEQDRLVGAMRDIEEMLDSRQRPPAPYLLRPHRPGDMGWVVHRHGVLYAREYGWDERFEALVAGIAARFIERYDAKREACWIAEQAGENIGSVFLVKKSSRVAQLRLLLVEPGARGLGVGTRLVEECIRFARHAGYRTMVLWTNDVLHDARRIYERAGFVRVHSEPHHSFGHDLTGETWELEL
jgi:DNA-binding MarR family transcriptional regulator/GNAT superfamily N-acetyltransferase